jgi:hypothetical protein
MTDFMYWLGDAFYWFFSLFEKLENLPNWSFIAVAFVLLFWWLNMQHNYTQKAERKGTLK